MDQQKLIDEFINITGDDQQARSYLESSNWNLELAINGFFQGTKPNVNNQPINNQPKPEPQQNTTPVQNDPPKNNTTPINNSSQKRVFGFGDYKGEEIKDKKQQEYYTGGKNSGINVIGPGEEDIMKKASNSGNKVESHEKKDIPKFSGTGFKLGDSDKESQIFNDNPIPPKDLIRVITLYKNGFTVDDGPLRSNQDPSNKEFLQDVSSGHVPRELEREARGKGELKVDMVDKRGEDYVPPVKKLESFTGTGLTLGVTTTKITEVKDIKFTVDENQPFTEIRIRLGNGKTVVSKFNLTHTIGDIKNYVSEITNTPLFQFELMNSFPKEIFNDNNKTVKEAGLVKGNILQKLN
eukprot:TRINITY_DN992_c0_g1_i1.p1 TRINITY_DN992_c0_g1~~TRINITY_DN992_c0_g1_i1.p1  ORF type:complete len:352 (-),score=134.86 TRINITY_DN992_c0_g1_i1:43-1098(-)